jgi:serine/threonine protein kinase/Tol biopolymer transport system component
MSAPLSAGTKLGRYEIRAKIGAGGMGEVYRARDEKLNRDVAIKVLPADLSQDVDRLRRFEQEAQAAGALNHSNILAVHDVGMHEDSPYIVSELLEGEELREQLNDGSLPQRKALDYAQQITQGLAAAHERGITHRDLKPENLFVTTEGRVKILDFGLAKLRPLRNETVSSEIDTRKQITDPGTVMGTVGYMSPEQVRGQEADHRSDIFSFGSILYEMLAGQRAFRRDTMAETMTAILKEEPTELSETNAKISLPLEKIVRRCLEKKPERRFHSASDLAFALEALSTSSGSQSTATALPPVTKSQTGLGRFSLFANAHVAWIAAAILLLTLLASLPFAIAYLRRPTVEVRPVVRYDISAPSKTALSLSRWPAMALSPDGSTLAFAVVSADGVNRLYVRKRDDPEVKPLAGTEGAVQPAFSPNGKSLAFVADLTLKKISLDGAVLSLTKVGDTRGVTWADDDTLVYSPESTEGLFQISSNGGAPRAITTVDNKKNERTHRWPEVLPGGKAVLFTVGTLTSPDNYDRSNIEAVILATGERRVVLQSASMARYVPTGHLIFAREGLLYAITFDAGSLTTHGNSVPVLQGVAGDKTTGAVHFAIANDGTLAYVPGSATSSLRRLVWVDRSGTEQRVNLPGGQYNDPRLSPDGSRVALLQGSSGSGDVWVYDFGRATFTRLTFTTTNATPLWSSDGNNIYYVSIDQAGNKTTIFRKPADGSRDAEAVTTINSGAYLEAIERDGEAALCDSGPSTIQGNIIRVPLKQDAQTTPIISTQFDEYAAALSADGRWLAYQSNESGQPEVYVRDMAGSGGRWQISTAGGQEPHWSFDGRELYYRNNNLFMSVAVDTRSAFQAGTPKTLFNGIFDLRSNSGESYDVDPKGNRFFMIRLAEDDSSGAQVRVVVNWFDELRRLVPTK